MVDYREIIRLGSDPHYSRRQIEAIVHSSHHTIENVLGAAKEKHITWPLDDSVTNQELQALLFPEKYASVSIYVEPNYSYIHDYLVSDGINKYSVPFDLIGEKVILRLTKNTVEIFYHGDRIASHVRIPVARQQPIVKPEHMPEEHRQYLKYNVDDFTVWGNSVGPNTSKVVKYFLTKDKEPEQGYKYCASLTKLAQKYSPKRLESACEKVLRIVGKPDIRTLSSILKNRQDKSVQSEVVVKSTESHGITCGADYYRNLKGGESK